MTQNLAHKKGVKQDRTKIRDTALRIIREKLERPDYWNRQRASRGLAAPPPLSIFRRLEPLGWGLADDDDWWFAPQDCAPDVVWPLDVGVIFDWTDGEEGVDLAPLSLRRNARGARSRETFWSIHDAPGCCAGIQRRAVSVHKSSCLARRRLGKR